MSLAQELPWLLRRSPVIMATMFCTWSAGLSRWNVMAQSLSQQLVPDSLRAPWLIGGLLHLTVALAFLPVLLRWPQLTHPSPDSKEFAR